VDGVWLVAGVLSGGRSRLSRFGHISWGAELGNYRSEIEALGRRREVN